jgi:5'-nucleotidase/UDP-sugar diphosphatase
MKPLKYLPNTINMKQFLSLLLFAGILLGCRSTQKPVSVDADDNQITFKFIQLNDVYEIAPLSGGKYGGMARVAYVRDSIVKENPNTLLFMAGDFLNPSLLGTIKLNGERIAGKQMIEVMNAMDFDLVTFGNHEFDIGEEGLQNRLNESEFTWTSANVLQVNEAGAQPFKIHKDIGVIPVKEYHIQTLTDNDGTAVSLGFISVTLPSNPQDFVKYGDIFSEAKEAYHELQGKVDVIIGLTHLEVEQDKKLAGLLPGMRLIMGGHEHNSMLVPTSNTTITKADANAKTIYIHTLTYNSVTGNLTIDSHLMPIDERTPSHQGVKNIVDRWTLILEDKIKEVVSNPDEVIYKPVIPLDGTDSASRAIQTNLGEIITSAMANSFEDEIDAALVNGGSIRLDDMLAGDVTSLDIFRVLPFGGGVLKVKMKGSLLTKVLDYGIAQRGTGAYLQRGMVTRNSMNGPWLIDNKPIDEEKIYTVAVSDFLMKGFDIPFLTESHPGVIEIYSPKEEETAYDIRKAVILYLKSLKK